MLWILIESEYKVLIWSSDCN